jgi:GNAT superfamily N-acetyltransferase
VYNNAWGGHHGFKKMEMHQAQGIIRSLKPVIDRDIIIFAFYDGQPIGFYVNIPELNQIFKYVNGNLNWIGKLKFLWHKWKGTPDIMVGLVFGVDRSFHGKGVEGALIKYAEEFIVPMNRYETTTLTWIGDFNPKMLKIAENLGASKHRTLHTYRYLFDREKEFKRAPMAT